jgi:hypothetical protein
MNCFESQRTLMAEPAVRTGEIARHLACCTACGRVAERLFKGDRDISEAALVRVPDALAERILLKRRGTPLREYAIAAAIVTASALTAIVGVQVTNLTSHADRVEALGPDHPAVAAISEVADDEIRPAASQPSAELQDVLKRVGVKVKPEAAMQYVGKCHVTATDCDHIVVSTPDAQANVMLVSNYAFGSRLMVADRRMTAVVNPTASGGYIVVAETPKAARRIEKVLVKG